MKQKTHKMVEKRQGYLKTIKKNYPDYTEELLASLDKEALRTIATDLKLDLKSLLFVANQLKRKLNPDDEKLQRKIKPPIMRTLREGIESAKLNNTPFNLELFIQKHAIQDQAVQDSTLQFAESSIRSSYSKLLRAKKMDDHGYSKDLTKIKNIFSGTGPQIIQNIFKGEITVDKYYGIINREKLNPSTVGNYLYSQGIIFPKEMKKRRKNLFFSVKNEMPQKKFCGTGPTAINENKNVIPTKNASILPPIENLESFGKNTTPSQQRCNTFFKTHILKLNALVDKQRLQTNQQTVFSFSQCS
ncbi:MAG: hypothetical protein H2069_06015 [Legionella sp.]|nr:hypothetical protein [Legionella sp.]